MPEPRDLGGVRHYLAQQLHRFRAEIRQVEEDTCDIAAWMRKAGGPAVSDGIRFQVHRDDRNRRCCVTRRANSRRGDRADRLNVLADEVRSHRGQLIQPFVRDAHDDLGVFSRPRCTKPLPKCQDSVVDGDRLSRMQKAYAPFSPGLRHGTERQRRGDAADKRDELAPLHCVPQEHVSSCG